MSIFVRKYFIITTYFILFEGLLTQHFHDKTSETCREQIYNCSLLLSTNYNRPRIRPLSSMIWANEHDKAQINIQKSLTDIKRNDFRSFVQVPIKEWKMHSDQQQKSQKRQNVYFFTLKMLDNYTLRKQRSIWIFIIELSTKKGRIHAIVLWLFPMARIGYHTALSGEAQQKTLSKKKSR